MTPSTRLRRRSGRRGQAGQMIVLFALCLIAIIAMAGLLIDGGSAWANRRQAQAAADTASLAGAVSLSNTAGMSEAARRTAAANAARDIAKANGFGPPDVDCASLPLTDGGVKVNWPPKTGPHTNDTGYVEVFTTRAMRTAFAGAVGFPCWMVTARAVSSVLTQVATCNFCSLSNWTKRHVLILDNGNDLRVDGDIFSNQDWWMSGTDGKNRCGGSDPCTPASCHDWDPGPPPVSDHRIVMCGESLYVDHSGGLTPTILSARTIAMVGGWQARSENDIIHADHTYPDCPAHPKDMHYTYLGKDPETNVCIGAKPKVDPLNDPGNPAAIIPVPDYNALSTCPGGPFPCGPVASPSCQAVTYNGLPTTLFLPPAGSTFDHPIQTSIHGTQGVFTICPGLYFGGFSVNGDNGSQPRVIMLPGQYVMVGGGFTVSGRASIQSVSTNASGAVQDGVFIYNTGGKEAFSENSVSDPTLIPPCPNPPLISLCTPTTSTKLNPPAVPSAPKLVGVAVTYKLTLTATPVPIGDASYFKFYNGDDLIACEGGVTVTTTATTKAASCITRYTTFGTKGITAVYAGDARYAPTGDMKTQEIVPPATADKGNFDINTFDGPVCGPVVAPCGQVILHAPTTGRYSGLLVFQDRAISFIEGGIGLRINPWIGAPACDMTPVATPLGTQPAFMAYGVPPDTHPVPAPCGQLGGLSGTIYAAHRSTDVPSDWDAIVNLMGSGLSNLQIIGAEIKFTQNGNQARFAFDASLFANGKIRLVE